MRSKLYILVFILLLLFTSVTSAYAGTRITGAAFGKNIGLIHLDFATATFPDCPEPEDPLNPKCPSNPDYDDYHLGFRNEFYIDKTDFLSMGSGDINIAASISDTADCSPTTCYLEGFIWSDAIGWIILDGQSIQTQGFPSSPGDFPESSFAQINFNGILTGYIWSQYTGWIRLSSDSFNHLLNQNETNWGVYMNPFEAEVEVTNSDCLTLDEPTCDLYPHVCEWDITCLSKTINLGHKFYGYAWSEKLGWIKFDTDELGLGVYTTWVPDITPPVINVPDLYTPWFANDDANGILDWPFFAIDEESGINIALTTLQFTADTVTTPGCFDGQIDESDDGSDGINIQLSTPGPGLIGSAEEGYCKYQITGTIVNGAGLYVQIGGTDPGLISPNEYIASPITFFVRAGDLSYPDSEIEAVSTGAVADGIDAIEYQFHPKDIAANPIVPVKVNLSGSEEIDPALWMRNTDIEFSFDVDEMFFDPITSIETYKNRDNVRPITIDDGTASTTYLDPECNTVTSSTICDNYPHVCNWTGSACEYTSILYPKEGVSLDPVFDAYPVLVSAWSPTTCNGCSAFTMNSIALTVTDADMPAVSLDGDDNPLVPAIPGNLPDGIEYIVDDNVPAILGANPFDSGPITYDFTPAVTISIDSEEEALSDTQLTPGSPNSMEFIVSNNSSGDIFDVSIDNRIIIYDDGTGDDLGSVLFEFRNIYLEGDTDPYKGRTDFATNYTSFEVFRGNPDNDFLADGTLTAFHSDTYNYHTNTYTFDGGDVPTTVNDFGVYEYTIDVPDPEADIVYAIDRSDYLGPLTSFNINATGSDTFKVNFTPEPIVEAETTVGINISMDVHQYVGYQMSSTITGVDDFAVYEAPDLITGIELRPVGVAATGIITGKQIYDVIGEREFETVTSPGLSILKQQMRDNAAELTRNMTACDAGTTVISGLTTDNDTCVRVDQYNQTVVAVYGGLGEVLKIGNGNTVTVPNGFRYTIIVKGGADVFIQDDIEYGGTGSFGLIVLTDADGKGGNVFIDTDVTNIVGLLYAEGSILSSEDGSNLCYATEACELTNQLYWQGSIVSKNTIGGAPGRKLPQGIDCEEDWSITDDLKCAQAFDLDYIRRFAIRPLKEDVTDALLGYYIPVGRLFSGGGTCNAVPECDDATLLLLPSTITTSIATNGSRLINFADSKSIDPFFIEKDARPAPPGFTTGAGFESTIEIR